jgi:hypothetical protein
MRSPGAVVAALLALAAIVAVVVVSVANPSSGTVAGPLDPGIEGEIGAGLRYYRGQSLSVGGGWVIRNPSDHQLTLDRVQAVGIVHGSPQVLGAYVVPLRNYDARLSWPGFRVPATGRSLPGAIIGPHEKLQFVLGLRATRQGRHTLRAVDILYHDGSSSYRTRAAYTITICTPVTNKPCEDALYAGH